MENRALSYFFSCSSKDDNSGSASEEISGQCWLMFLVICSAVTPKVLPDIKWIMTFITNISVLYIGIILISWILSYSFVSSSNILNDVFCYDDQLN